MPGLDDLKKLANQHDDKVDAGLDKAGDAAGEKFGRGDQIDKGVDWAQQHTGSGDQARAEDANRDTGSGQ